MRKLLLHCIIFSLLSTPASAIETAARQALLIDMNTHTVLLAKDAESLMHPSSMSKLMTLYVLFQRLKDGHIKLDSTFPVSEKAWRMQGSKMFVHVGDQVTVDDLIHGISTLSGNDACIVVAEGISGNEDAFAQEMNRVATKIGLKHSHFTNATGWPDEKHQMSAHDLAILAERLIADFPEYYPYFAQEEYSYNKIKQLNRNRLLGSGIGVDGLKTGHTEAGGYGITLSAKQNDRRLVLVINGLPDDDARVQEGDQLLRYGFREFTNKTIAKKGEAIAEAEVWLGTEKTVPLVADEDIEITLPIARVNETKFTVKYNGPIQAPVKQGSHIADLIISNQSLPNNIIPLMAGSDIDKRSAIGRVFSLINHVLFYREP